MINARMLIQCPDRTGVVARVAAFLAGRGLNILDADQHSDPDTGRFFMRVEFEGGDPAEAASFDAAFGPLADELGITSRVRWPEAVTGRAARVAVLAGPGTHCSDDILWRFNSGELPGRVTRVISNHTNARPMAELFGIRFDHVPVAGDQGKASPADAAAQEAAVLDLLAEDDSVDGGLDLIVLARYMRVLSAGFVDRFSGPSNRSGQQGGHRIINIHHSFLPAFQGARPYHRAFERGVKLIGATSHYVTADLDEGPIIAQDVARVSHRDTVGDLVRKGRDLERVVLAEAVRLHLADRVLVSGNKTVVFG